MKKHLAFLHDRSGNFGIIFSLSLLPIMGVLGAAIDYTMLQSREAKLQHAADAAVLAAVHDAKSVSDFHRLAKSYIEANYTGADLGITPKVHPYKVTLRVRDSYKTIMLGAIGHGEIDMEITAEAAVRRNKIGSIDVPDSERMPSLEQIEAERKRLLAQIGNFPPRSHEKLRRKINRNFDRLLRKTKRQTGQLRLTK